MSLSSLRLPVSGLKFELAIAAAVMLGGAVILAAVAAPLLVYSVSLATFGLAHVLSELRYVDRRFGRTLGMSHVAVMSVLLAGAVAARAGGVFGILGPAVAVTLELSCVAALALSAAQGGLIQRALALGLAAV